MKIQLPNNWKEIAGISPLSYQRLDESADDALADRIFNAALKYHNGHSHSPKEKAPTKAGVRSWAKEYFKLNPKSKSDSIDDLVEAFFESWDH